VSEIENTMHVHVSELYKHMKAIICLTAVTNAPELKETVVFNYHKS
jgi:hypothetical protein